MYPAASLWCWGAERNDYAMWRKYKKEAGNRITIAAWLCHELRIDTADAAAIARTDHGLDAVLAAVTARAAQLDMTVPCPSADTELAGAEGWIHLPKAGVQLRDLLR